MRATRRLETGLTLLLGGVFVLGLIGAVRPGGEIFPFASWFLFSQVPQRVTAYELRVVEWNGQKFDPPLSARNVPSLLRSPRSSTVRDIMQRIGRATDLPRWAGDRKLAWSLLQGQLHADQGTGLFAIVRVSYDPLERWRDGTQQEVEVGRTAWPLVEP